MDTISPRNIMPTLKPDAAPRILVHVHLFYPDLWPEIAHHLRHITSAIIDLHLTTVVHYPDLEKDVRCFFPRASLFIVENRGYDIGPFIHILKKVRLEDYDLVIKLHTKRDMPQGSLLGSYNVSGNKWRRALIDFLSTPHHVDACIQSFKNDMHLGMTAHHSLIFYHEPSDPIAKSVSYELLRQANLPSGNFSFVAGTMFMARASLFLPIKNMMFDLTDFHIPNRDIYTSLPHAFERFFGLLITAQGYRIVDVFTPLWKQKLSKLGYPFRKALHFAYRKKITKNNRKIIKIIKIPVWNSKI